MNPVLRESAHGAFIGAYVGTLVGAAEAVFYLGSGVASVSLVFVGAFVYSLVGGGLGFCLGRLAGVFPFHPFNQPGAGAALSFLGTAAVFGIVVLGLLPRPPDAPLHEKVQDAVCVILSISLVIVGSVTVLAPRFGKDVRRSAAMPSVMLLFTGIIVVACGYTAIVPTHAPTPAVPNDPAFQYVPNMPPDLRSKPNTLWVVVHGLRRDALGAYYNTPRGSLTPNLDGLASQSILFEQAVAASSAPAPAMASLLTGRDVRDHGVFDVDGQLPATVPTLAQVQRDRGYITAAVVSHPVLTEERGFSQGFSHYLIARGFGGLPGMYGGELTRMRVVRLGLVIVAAIWEARKELPCPGCEGAGHGVGSGGVQPYSYKFQQATSAPFSVPPAPAGAQVLQASRIPTSPDIALRMASQFIYAKRDTRWSLMVQLDIPMVTNSDVAYSQGVRALDSAFGSFIQGLDPVLMDNTLIVFTADHGTAFGDRGALPPGDSLDDESLLVPLILKMPGRVYAGTRFAGQVRALDAFVTSVELQDARMPPKVLGRSVRGERSLLPDVSSNNVRVQDECELRKLSRIRRVYAAVRKGKTEIRALRSSLYKYVETTATNGQSSGQFYDLIADPFESRDLSGSSQSNKCSRSLATIREQMVSFVNAKTGAAPTAPKRAPGPNSKTWKNKGKARNSIRFTP